MNTGYQMNSQYHSHYIGGMTSFNNNHHHEYQTLIQYAPDTIGHTHQFYTFTTTNSGHRHQMVEQTGPAIYMANGQHYHLYGGITSRDGRVPHTHQFEGQTTLSVQN